MLVAADSSDPPLAMRRESRVWMAAVALETGAGRRLEVVGGRHLGRIGSSAGRLQRRHHIAPKR